MRYDRFTKFLLLQVTQKQFVNVWLLDCFQTLLICIIQVFTRRLEETLNCMFILTVFCTQYLNHNGNVLSNTDRNLNSI